MLSNFDILLCVLFYFDVFHSFSHVFQHFNLFTFVHCMFLRPLHTIFFHLFFGYSLFRPALFLTVGSSIFAVRAFIYAFSLVYLIYLPWYLSYVFLFQISLSCSSIFWVLFIFLLFSRLVIFNRHPLFFISIMSFCILALVFPASLPYNFEFFGVHYVIYSLTWNLTSESRVSFLYYGIHATDTDDRKHRFVVLLVIICLTVYGCEYWIFNSFLCR